MPKVSVVLSSYNHAKYVAETIESVLSQTYQDFEFIITDDGSSDETVEVIKKFADPRIKLFCFSNNQGACVAMNNCIKEAKCEYIAVINSDDAWMPDKLEKQVNFLDRHPENGAVFGYAQFIDDEGNDLGYAHHYNRLFIQPNRTRFEWLRHFFESGNCLCHPSVLIRKQCYNEVGFYDERFAQLPDFDFWIRLCMKYDIFIMPENLVKFRLCQSQGNASGNTPKNSSRVTLESAQILKNYLRAEVFEDLVNIFPLTENISELGLSRKIKEVDRDIAPFFIAMLASRDNRHGHKYFCFDVLYQMYSNKEIAQKLRDQYSFDFSNLVSLAWDQDIFGIVALEQVQSQLCQNQGQMEQSEAQLHQTQAELANAQAQQHQTEVVLEQLRSQLHQTQQELEQSNSQLHQTQQELEQSNSQLHQTQQELEQSNSQLHQTQQELEQTQLQLHQNQQELEQTQLQLHQTEAVLENSQSQLHQTEAVLENSQSQLHQTEAVLEQSIFQHHQTQIELKETQVQLHPTQLELKHTKTLLDQTQRELEYIKTLLHETQRELEYINTLLHIRHREGERDQFQKTLASQPMRESQMQYELLVWDAWYAYQNNNLIQMQECLKQSLKCTPFSPTETVIKWIESFSKLALKKGEGFDAKSLTNSAEWKQLMSRVLVAKPMLYKS
jgi:glycosyltransferase involved in cell wall biosynthesis